MGIRCVDAPFQVRPYAPRPLFCTKRRRMPYPGIFALAHFADRVEGSGPGFGQRGALERVFREKSGTAQIIRSGLVRR